MIGLACSLHAHALAAASSSSACSLALARQQPLPSAAAMKRKAMTYSSAEPPPPGGKQPGTPPVLKLLEISRKLSSEVDGMSFTGAAYVYNPLIYAWPVHEAYVRAFSGRGAQVVLVGMNPGPFGMAQTGVPFGEVSFVRDWMGLRGEVAQPPKVHPKRPIDGLACTKSEVSGSRLWGWAQRRYKEPERFFSEFYVVNYCPLAFMSETGANVVPEKLKAAERKELFAACDAALAAQLEVLQPRLVVGVGKFAEKRSALCAPAGVQVGGILHPSPASPLANKGWEGQMEAQLAGLGVDLEALAAQ